MSPSLAGQPVETPPGEDNAPGVAPEPDPNPTGHGFTGDTFRPGVDRSDDLGRHEVPSGFRDGHGDLLVVEAVSVEAAHHWDERRWRSLHS